MRRDRKGCGDLLCVAEKQMKKAWQFQAASGSQRMESHYFFCATAAATGRMLRSLSVAASAVNLFAKKKKKKSHKAQTKKQLWKVQGCGSGSIISLTCCVMAVQAQHHWHRAQSVQESRLVHEWPKASFSVAVLPFFPPSSPVLTNSAETVGLTRREMSCLNGRKNMSPNWSRAMLPPWVGPCCSESTEWIIEVV